MARLLIVILCSLSAMAAWAQKPMNPYTAAWKKVDSLIRDKGLNRSARTEVDKIYKLAKKEKNDAQIIKSLIYLTRLDVSLNEDSDFGIETLRNELKTAKAPAKQLLHSILAAKYQEVLDANRFKLYGRAPVAGQNDDPGTWGLDELHDQITTHYKASLSQAEILQKTRLEPYDAIIEKGNSRSLRPTLYDMLAFKALSCFVNNERDIRKPAYQFSINQPEVFSDAAAFSKMKFRSSDSSSLYFLALQTYQGLLAFHLNDKDPAALLDADLARLRFMQEVSTVSGKDDLYRDALDKIRKKYPAHPYGALAAVMALEQDHQQAIRYEKGISTNEQRFALVGIRKSLQQLIGKFPQTEADALARNLLTNIDTKSISAKTELVVIPGKQILSLVEFRNLDEFFYRLVAVGQEQENRRDQKKYWQSLASLKPIRQVRQLLPNPGDLREHRMEIGIDPLPPGDYALLTSATDDFLPYNNEMSVQYFHVSNISYINRGDHYFLLHRESGQPLPSAEVRIMENSFSQQLGRTQLNEVGRRTTNGDGYVKLSLPEESRQFSLDIRWAGERLFTRRSNYYYRYNPRDEDGPRELTALFTDRSIYRPGQTVYFKGIKIRRETDGSGSAVIAGRKTTLRLHDANGQKKDSLVLTTNRFGSYYGQFQIPVNLLTGNFSIIDEDGYAAISFRVEEYKRPTFETVFDTAKASFRLGEDVKTSGTVRGYAGNTLNGVKIKYRVVRRTVLPWRWSGYNWPNSSAETEIANGETAADQNGKFSITFKALPDLTINRELSPQFNFEIIADATDNSGETRTATKNLSIGYRAVVLSLDMDRDVYHADSLKHIKVTATNAEAIPQNLDMRVTIWQLEGPRRMLKGRIWDTPDTSVLNRYDFSQLFPNDPYMNEADPAGWKKTNEVFNKNSSTKEPVRLPDQLAPGYYVIEVSAKDQSGQELNDKRYIRIRTNSNDPMYPSYLSIVEGNKLSQPGSTVTTQLGSSAENVFLIRQVDKNGADSTLPYHTDQLSNAVKSVAIPVLESDRGGFDIVHLFVKQNRFYQVIQHVDVPWTNKQLDVSVETWRDKMLPGSRETWKIRVRGAKGEKLAAELLTSMYDASLDQFYPHHWNLPDLFRKHQSTAWTAHSNFASGQTESYLESPVFARVPEKNYDAFIWKPVVIRGDEFKMYAAPMMNAQADAVLYEKVAAPKVAADSARNSAPKADAPVSVRKNFNETAFFFPELQTDEQGNISFSFTVPESLTRWKWQMLAHTADLSMGMAEREALTQKDLMIQPNLPRFLREGDKVLLSARVSNLTDQEITGQARLELIDPETNQPVDGWFQNIFPTQYFTADARQSTAVHFEIQVPVNYNKALQYRISAQAGKHIDGEERALAVLSNRMLVTESKPIMVKGNGTKNIQLKSLLEAAGSSTLSPYRITVEYSTNPVWYAVLALPYIMEGAQDCSEQHFNQFYANALASLTANSSPAILKMFEKWRSSDSSVFISNLMKNPELRSVLAEQTPWVLEARTEAEQRRNMAMLFDLVKLSSELSASLGKLGAMQLGNGSFPWFKGGMEDRFMTQYILSGLGRLSQLKAIPAASSSLVERIVSNGLLYLDARIRDDHEQLLKSKVDVSKDNLGPLQVQYLYMRTFFKAPIPASSKKAYDYYYGQAGRYWVGKGLMTQGMIAIVLNRSKNKIARDVLKSLQENAQRSEELGMYWKSNTRGYYWYQSPIETQAFLLETFAELGGKKEDLEQMKLWLLNQKRVQRWPSSKATADAVYALLISGANLSGAAPAVSIQLGAKKIDAAAEKQEAGTGYFTKILGAKEISPDMGNISIDVKGNTGSGISWGAVHWQYFEDMDKIWAANSPVQIMRQFFVEKNSDKGPVLVPVAEGGALKVGDRIRIRIILKADRDMEYMHLRDMRASGTEPVNVLSQHKWQGGLGYYESTRDTGTDFFFSWLPKGTWVFEYPVVVTHTGRFGAGISTIQSMYAPEFNAHSEGTKMEVRD